MSPAPEQGPPLGPWRRSRPTPPLLLAALGLGLGLVLGAGAGFVLHKVWPWVVGELVLGVALGLGVAIVARAPRVPAAATWLGALGVCVGLLVGHYVALTRGLAPPGFGAFVANLLAREPALGSVRLGTFGNVVLQLVRLGVVAWVARQAAVAWSGARGFGTPRAVRTFVAEAHLRGDDADAVRAALAARGVTDPDAQSDALHDGHRTC